MICRKKERKEIEAKQNSYINNKTKATVTRIKLKQQKLKMGK